nr:O-methyltransferase [Raoultella sp. NCTC 9187]
MLENNQRAGLPAYDVAANQGQFLALLVRITRARRVLEIGTLGGYSTIWMARELPPDGELLTLESRLAPCADRAAESSAGGGGRSGCAARRPGAGDP